MNRSYLLLKEDFFKHLNTRPYRIGLDLGVGSIGFAVTAIQNINGNSIPIELILEGSHIFNASIGAAERRLARGQRNSHRHNRNRLLVLWKFLSEHKMIKPILDHRERRSYENTADAMFDREIQKLCPYELRLKAIHGKIYLRELGYALYHLANHRGSSSIRLSPGASDDDITTQKSLLETKVFAKKHPDAKTFIELLNLNNKEYGQGFRNKQGRLNNLMPTRNLILAELEKICTVQQKFYPQIFTENFITRLSEIINYENEKIVPDAGACPFFSEEQKLPKCHFLNEERRLWEALNNTRIDGTSLDEETKKSFFEYLRSGKTISPEYIRKSLNLYKDTEITLQGRGKEAQKIQGFRFTELENKSFWKRLSSDTKDQFFAYWTNCADDTKLIQHLQKDFGLTLEEAEDALVSIKLIGDYAPIGKKAMLIVIEYLKDPYQNKVLSFHEAVDQAIADSKLPIIQNNKIYNVLPYYGAVLNDTTQPLIGKAWHSSLRNKFETAPHRYIRPTTSKDEAKFGRIANPVVHQTLNELRKLINEIIFILGAKPSEIGIELSRELKIGAEEREKLSRQQNLNENVNKRIYEDYCKPNNLDESYIIRFQIAEEQGLTCPYCLNSFKAADIADGSVDLDHILPISQSADNSKNNLVAAHKCCNQTLKGAKTPYQAFATNENWNQILQFVEEKIPKKLWRFKLDSAQYSEWLNHRGFLSRFSTDTSYITKAAAKYLQCLFEDKSKRNVRTLKGAETSTLRKAWGIHNIAHELGSRLIEDQTGSYLHPQKKVRIDHRHHALDAITIAYSTNGYTKLINTLHEKGFKLHGIQKIIPLPHMSKIYETESVDETVLGDQESFRQYIKNRLEHKSLISIKYDHDKNGQLLKETAYRILFEKNEQIVLVTKKKLSNIGESLVDIDKSLLPKMYSDEKLNLYSESEQNKLKKLLIYNKNKRNQILDNMQISEQKLIEQNERLKTEGKKELEIDEKAIVKNALMLTGGFYYQISNNEKSKKFIKIQPSENQNGVAYDTGENLRIDLYYDSTGKLCGEVIRKVNAMDNSFVPQYKKLGYYLLESIYQGDTLEIDSVNPKDLNEKSTSLEFTASVKCPNSPAGKTFVRIATFTEIANDNIRIFVQNLLKAKKGQDASFTISSMQKWNVRRVILSTVGLIKYRSSILKNKE